jgi:hypothetical protein
MSQEVVAPYLDTLISKLLALLQHGQRMVQEGALTAMASVADCAKASFIRYYDQACRPNLPPVAHAPPLHPDILICHSESHVLCVPLCIYTERGADHQSKTEVLRGIRLRRPGV